MAEEPQDAEGEPEVSEEQVERATSLLDVRKIIGSLLGVYGVMLLLAGILGSDADKDQAAGVNINLWVGLALIVVCGLFWGWALTRPLTEELQDASSGPENDPGPEASAAG